MKNKASFFFYFCVVILFSGCVHHQLNYYSPQGALPHVSRQMKTAGFWVGRLSSPDQTVLSENEIILHNSRIQDDGLTKEILSVGLNHQELKDELLNSLKKLSAKGFLLADGKESGEDFFSRQEQMMNLDALSKETASTQWGVILHYADQRILPTDEGLFAAAFDIDFDELQNSSLDVGTPVIIRHRSDDGSWQYVQSALSDGWVKSENIAAVEQREAKTFIRPEKFIVVSDAKADIFHNAQMTDYYDYARMGTVLPLVSENDSTFEVKLPTGSGFIKKNQAHRGFLELSQRRVLEQAFKLLNNPYGWGGMYGEQDCSAFIIEVFSPFGIQLPRNSKEQAQASSHWISFDGVSEEDKLSKIIKDGAAGVTLLHMKGHIMLYVGHIDGRAYAIHAVWGYRQPKNKNEDQVYVLNQVTVSDLSLGEGSKKGSLLRRLTSMSIWK
jgi:hypothetical protein